MLYVEGSSGPARRGVYTAPVRVFRRLYRIDPKSGKVSRVNLPIDATDFAIDDVGHLYLRKRKLLGRFDLDSLREVPFDYGEERPVGKNKVLVSALVLPGADKGATPWESGIGVNSKGDVVVSSNNSGKGGMKRYSPVIYPGRLVQQDIHVFDKHGKVLFEDAIKGTPTGYGVFIDNRRNVYFLAGANRLYGKGKETLRGTGCVMKFKPGIGKFYATSGAKVPLSKDIPVDGLPCLWNTPAQRFYVEGAEWVFPGVGWVPQYCCKCWNCRFAVDHFGRSFVPQHNRYQVAILDTNGNLIRQVGRYGNVDDGMPLHPWNDRRAEPPRSIGGDEVALAYANYTGTSTDHYLFIYDAGNDVIRSVKLGYHASASVGLDGAAE
jgi:hypothetical protein